MEVPTIKMVNSSLRASLYWKRYKEIAEKEKKEKEKESENFTDTEEAQHKISLLV